MEINFGASAPYTVGVEEEFQLVDPESLALIPKIKAVLAARDAAGLSADGITSELSASCLEARSPACATIPELARELSAARSRVRKLVEGCGARLVAAGAHPFSDSVEQEITADDRYRQVEERMGWTARMQAIYGLHVHVAVPDAGYAIRAVNALSRYVPLFIALSANSPFWNGYDTGLASVRARVFGLVPRSGLPPAFREWEDFERYVDVRVKAGLIADYSWCWWDARPHPKLGTVELRAPDVQTNTARTSSLAALAQCLVATAGEHAPEDPLSTEENKWSAIRYGLDARLHDFAIGESMPTREVARKLVAELAAVSRDLGCEAELEGVLEIVESGNGAEEQRRTFAERGSLKDVAAHLVAATS
ncbi:MAG TPA: glutamate--cysteine ligase [Rubrobacteraceae bacterium]|nr:glutamate--cysteine ligase [Rubrobacteraceae bacterium]